MSINTVSSLLSDLVIKFRCYSHVEIHIQVIMVSDERFGRCSTRDHVHQRCFYLKQTITTLPVRSRKYSQSQEERKPYSKGILIVLWWHKWLQYNLEASHFFVFFFPRLERNATACTCITRSFDFVIKLRQQSAWHGYQWCVRTVYFSWNQILWKRLTQ